MCQLGHRTPKRLKLWAPGPQETPGGSGLGRGGSAFLRLLRDDAGGAAAPAGQQSPPPVELLAAGSLGRGAAGL